MWEKIKSFFALVGVFFLGLFCGKLFNNRRTADGDTGTDADNQSGSGSDKEREQRITNAGARIEHGTDAITEASGRIEEIIAEVRRTERDADLD